MFNQNRTPYEMKDACHKLSNEWRRCLQLAGAEPLGRIELNHAPDTWHQS